MARTRRGEGEAFDNSISGQAFTSQERTIAGAVPPVELGIWADNLISGQAQPTTRRADNYIVGSTTPTAENVKVGG